MNKDEYERLILQILEVSDTVGVPPFFWDDVDVLSQHWEINFWTYYYFDTNEELVEVDVSHEAVDYAAWFYADIRPQNSGSDCPRAELISDSHQELMEAETEVLENFELSDAARQLIEEEFDEVEMVQSGARLGIRSCNPFSRYWYVCKASELLMRCLSNNQQRRSRAIFWLGMFIAEAHWKDRTEEPLSDARNTLNVRRRAGAGGAATSRNRRLENLSILMSQIERLQSAVGIMSEDRIVEQAFEEARERASNFPKTKKILDDYGTTLRSEEPFKSRYEAIFRKNA